MTSTVMLFIASISMFLSGQLLFFTASDSGDLVWALINHILAVLLLIDAMNDVRKL